MAKKIGSAYHKSANLHNLHICNLWSAHLFKYSFLALSVAGKTISTWLLVSYSQSPSVVKDGQVGIIECVKNS
jgi:hypothetical protein